MTRRGFFKHLIRYAVAGGMVYGILRLKKNKQLDTSCINNSYCPPCSLTENCNLPQALSYRKFRKSEPGKT